MLIFCVNIRAEKSLTYCKTPVLQDDNIRSVCSHRLDFILLHGRKRQFFRHLQCLSRDKVHDRGGLNALKYPSGLISFLIF